MLIPLKAPSLRIVSEHILVPIQSDVAYTFVLYPIYLQFNTQTMGGIGSDFNSPWQVEPFPKVEAPSCHQGRNKKSIGDVCVWRATLHILPEFPDFCWYFGLNRFCAPTCHFMQTFTFPNFSFSRVQDVVQTLDSTVLPKAIDIPVLGFYNIYMYGQNVCVARGRGRRGSWVLHRTPWKNPEPLKTETRDPKP